jgi:hypothetical protein
VKNIVVLYTIIGALAVLLALSLLRRSAKPLVDPATAALIDSLQQTHQADSVRIDLATARAAALSRAADSAIARARAIEARGGVVGSRASVVASAARSVDSSAKPGTAVRPDSSARLWKEAYELRSAEVDSLHRAIALREQGDTNRVIARGIDTAVVSDLRARLARTEAANRGLEDAIKRANARGHLFGISWLPYPTRTEAAIGGTVAGIIADQLLIRPRQKN